MNIVPYEDSKPGGIVQLSLRAWEPVFDSIRKVMDPDVYREQHPDWRVTQRHVVESICADEETRVWIASEGSRTLEFVALQRHPEERLDESSMIAVDPEAQQRGVATAFTQHALTWFKESGMTTVVVDTGGDPGHAPAHRTYESAGFRPFPIARYFKKL